MGVGCDLRLERRDEDGLKRLRIKLPQPLQAKRRDVLAEARRLRDVRRVDVPLRELEAAVIEGTWRAAYKPLEPTRQPAPGPFNYDWIYVYNKTLWDMKDYMDHTMLLEGQTGSIRSFYALLR